MKTNILLFLLAFALQGAFAQSPALINYQAVVRDSNGTLITSGSISLGISIHDAITGGNQLYSETHNGIMPNTFGIVNVLIGGGTVNAGNFLTINWGNGSKYLQVYVNSNPIGSRTQMVSVPYALYANKADSTTTAANGVPVGTIMAYAGSNVPAGWLACDGANVSRSTYANLFASIGIAWGYGDQTTTFNLPDLRGMFLRGVSGNTGRDPDAGSRTAIYPGANTGNAVGSWQNDVFPTHAHSIGDHTHNAGGLYGQLHHSLGLIRFTEIGTPQWNKNAEISIGGAGSSGAEGSGLAIGGNTGAAGATNTSNPINPTGETRPKNLYVLYIIKY